MRFIEWCWKFDELQTTRIVIEGGIPICIKTILCRCYLVLARILYQTMLSEMGVGFQDQLLQEVRKMTGPDGLLSENGIQKNGSGNKAWEQRVAIGLQAMCAGLGISHQKIVTGVGCQYGMRTEASYNNAIKEDFSYGKLRPNGGRPITAATEGNIERLENYLKANSSEGRGTCLDRFGVRVNRRELNSKLNDLLIKCEFVMDPSNPNYVKKKRGKSVSNEQFQHEDFNENNEFEQFQHEDLKIPVKDKSKELKVISKSSASLLVRKYSGLSHS